MACINPITYVYNATLNHHNETKQINNTNKEKNQVINIKLLGSFR